MLEADVICELVESAVDGDRAALEQLLLDHFDLLAGHLKKRLPSSIQATVGVEDVIQQTYAQVFASIGKFQPREGATFASWLFTISEHQLYDAIRAQHRKKRGGELQRVRGVVDENDSYADLLDMLAGPQHTPSKSVARREGIQAVQVAMAALSEDHRRAVQLRYFDGCSLEETAALMGRTTGAVRGLLDRARKKMRESLQRASLYFSSK